MSKTKEELKKIAMDIVDCKIFTHTMLNSHSDMGMVFMPIMLGAFSEMSEEEKNDIGLIYEYYSEAGPRGFNGNPMFMSCSWLNKADTKEMFEIAQKYAKIKEQFENENKTDSKSNT